MRAGGSRRVDIARFGFKHFAARADLVDEVGGAPGDGEVFVGARRPGDDGPTLFDSLAVRSPAEFPGVCVIPTTEHVFVGAGRTMLCYRREGGRWTRAWRDRTDLFWSWGVHDDIVLMSAELELAAWTTYGEPRWSRFVEPPWSYTVVDSTVHLDVKGR